MKIDIPSEEECHGNKSNNLIQGLFGFLVGLIFFGFAGLRIFLFGFDAVEWYTWVALLIGVCSFTFIAYKFGDSFWSLLSSS